MTHPINPAPPTSIKFVGAWAIEKGRWPRKDTMFAVLADGLIQTYHDHPHMAAAAAKRLARDWAPCSEHVRPRVIELTQAEEARYYRELRRSVRLRLDERI